MTLDKLQKLCDEHVDSYYYVREEQVVVDRKVLGTLIAVARAASNPALESGESEVYKWLDALKELRAVLVALAEVGK